jgi:hypothetical protein
MPWLDARDAQVPISIYLGDPPALVSGCDVLELSWGWGAGNDQGVTTQADAGSGTIRLLDPERAYGPLGNLAPIGTPVTIYLGDTSSGQPPAFVGRIDDSRHDLSVSELAIVDDVAALAAVQFVETSVPAQVTSSRITRILDLAAWPANRRDIQAGGVPLQAGTIASDAWSELIEVARNELGAVWITPAGVVTFRTRASAWGGGGAPLATLGCPPSLAFLTDLTMRADQSDLVNVLAAARRTGTQRTISDSPSITKYRPHTHVQNDLELASDGDRDLWSSFYLTRSREPAKGVGSITSRPGASAIASLLALPFGGIVLIQDQGHGPDISERARWLGTRWVAQPDAVELTVVLGMDQSITSVARSLVLETGTDWAAYQTTPAPRNAAAREPGIQIAVIPKRPTGAPFALLREAIADRLDDRPTPLPGDDRPEPKGGDDA